MENPRVLATEAVASDKENAARNRRFTSYALFGLGALFVVLGTVSNIGATGLIFALAALLAGLVFYRRGK